MSMPDVKYMEYLWHLYFENKTPEDLPFEEHIHHEGFDYSDSQKRHHDAIFIKHKFLFENRSVIDIGAALCEKMIYAAHAGAICYCGVEPNYELRKYGEYIMEYLPKYNWCTFSLCPDVIYPFSSDTVTMFSVLHYMDDPAGYLEKLSHSLFEDILIDFNDYNDGPPESDTDMYGKVVSPWPMERTLTEVEKYWKLVDLTNIGTNRYLLHATCK